MAVPALVGRAACMCAALLGCALVAACSRAGDNATATGTGVPDVVLRNESVETVCYVHLSPASLETWGPDRLRADEVVEPGVTRDFELPLGRYDVRLLDCNGTEMFVRESVEVQGDGVVITFRSRE